MSNASENVMNGAESLIRTMVAGGVDVCFANPGTSEMHLVAALDRVDEMRCVLALFEGVATGAADGYARMAEKPAVNLFHLGPGLANGLANLHNAKKARSAVINIVGDHTLGHQAYESPLKSDVQGVARPFSSWVKSSQSSESLAADGAAAIAEARKPPGGIATLIVPSDVAWGTAAGIAPVPAIPARARVNAAAIANAAKALRSGEPTLILLTGSATRARALEFAGRIAAATGAKLFAQNANARIERGAGRVVLDRVPIPVDMALTALKDFRHLILVESAPPVSYFGFQGKPSVLTPDACVVHTLTEPHEDSLHALEWLADEIGARTTPFAAAEARATPVPTGAMTLENLGLAIAGSIPDNAIVVDEAITSGRGFFPQTRHCPPHDWLQITGGAIGSGLPMGIGAAIACPDRKVICLQGDGSAMYTLQALWTQAHENLNITTVLFSNRSYAILRTELANIGVRTPGRNGNEMLELGRPDLDWVGLAKSMGVAGSRVTTIDEFVAAFRSALATQGPGLVEVAL